MNLKFVCLLPFFIHLFQVTLAQSNQENLAANAKSFFSEVSSEGGLWEMKIKEKDNPYQCFLIKFSQTDSSSIHANIYGVTSKKDTLLFWTAWEFQEISTGENIFIQRSPYGQYAKGKSWTPSSVERYAAFDIHMPNGVTVKHKDVHTLQNNNQMITESSYYDEEQQEWIQESKAVWEKIIK